jgi:hypothetical protein
MTERPFGDWTPASRGERGGPGEIGKQKIVGDESERNSTSTRCRYCGSDATEERSNELRDRGATFQVIVACGSCGAAFAALSRN